MQYAEALDVELQFVPLQCIHFMRFVGNGYELHGYVELTWHVSQLELSSEQLASSRDELKHPRVVEFPTEFTKQYATSVVGAGHRVPTIFVGSCKQLVLSVVHSMHVWSTLPRLLQTSVGS